MILNIILTVFSFVGLYLIYESMVVRYELKKQLRDEQNKSAIGSISGEEDGL